jgi:methylated-DNA-[protein]-cysteine S-methyltransferase
MQADALEAALRGRTTDPTADLAAALTRAEAEDLVDVAYATTGSPIGPLLVAATPVGLVRVAFQTEGSDEVLDDLAGRVSPRILEAPARLDEIRRELDEYFEGRRNQFELPLDWRLSRGFRKRVLERLYADVGYGRTVSYLELATLVGSPTAGRAVGIAMATNPIPIVVPCHRVVRTGGNLGGYRGGLPTKVKLLELEAGRPLAV